MALVSGPRLGPAAVAERIQLERLKTPSPIVVFDELHKDKKWKGLRLL